MIKGLRVMGMHRRRRRQYVVLSCVLVVLLFGLYRSHWTLPNAAKEAERFNHLIAGALQSESTDPPSDDRTPNVGKSIEALKYLQFAEDEQNKKAASTDAVKDTSQLHLGVPKRPNLRPSSDSANENGTPERERHTPPFATEEDLTVMELQAGGGVLRQGSAPGGSSEKPRVPSGGKEPVREHPKIPADKSKSPQGSMQDSGVAGSVLRPGGSRNSPPVDQNSQNPSKGSKETSLGLQMYVDYPYLGPEFGSSRHEGKKRESGSKISIQGVPSRRKEKFPVKIQYRLPQPTDSELPTPRIQAEVSVLQKSRDAKKLERIRQAFQGSWEVYKLVWGHDEVTPITKQARDPFSGWAVTAIDSLDSLVLLGMDEEVERVVGLVSEMSFNSLYREYVPVFETVIRVLGGLLSGYELTDGKYPVLLDKARELGDFLMGSFDTPNRMPLLYFRWKAEDFSKKRLASIEASLAELGSLSLEFTKLAELTGKDSYFDAVHRITTLLEEAGPKMSIPDLFPSILDISGCELVSVEEAKQHPDAFLVGFNGLAGEGVKNSYCIPTGVKASPSRWTETYTMGGLADSFYEYLVKEAYLLEGTAVSKQYASLYTKAVDQAKKFLLFRPKLPGAPDILAPGSAEVIPNRRRERKKPELERKPQIEHLGCYLGGTLALGARLLNRPDDLVYAEKLTQGCIWFYEQMPTGIMPERFRVEMCPADGADGACDFDVEAERKYIAAATSVDSSESAEEDGGVLKRRQEAAEVKLKIPPTGESATSADDALFNVKVQPLDRKDPQIPLVDAQDGKEPRWPNNAYDTPVWMRDITPHYGLRPEGIESIFYMYRITGDNKWQAKGWEMFEQIEKYCKASTGAFSALKDVTAGAARGDKALRDEMESFWLSETLKYLYLLFEDANVWSLDDFVFNTEAHPFRRMNPNREASIDESAKSVDSGIEYVSFRDANKDPSVPPPLRSLHPTSGAAAAVLGATSSGSGGSGRSSGNSGNSGSSKNSEGAGNAVVGSELAEPLAEKPTGPELPTPDKGMEAPIGLQTKPKPVDVESASTPVKAGSEKEGSLQNGPNSASEPEVDSSAKPSTKGASSISFSDKETINRHKLEEEQRKNGLGPKGQSLEEEKAEMS